MKLIRILVKWFISLFFKNSVVDTTVETKNKFYEIKKLSWREYLLSKGYKTPSHRALDKGHFTNY